MTAMRGRALEPPDRRRLRRHAVAERLQSRDLRRVASLPPVALIFDWFIIVGARSSSGQSRPTWFTHRTSNGAVSRLLRHGGLRPSLGWLGLTTRQCGRVLRVADPRTAR